MKRNRAITAKKIEVMKTTAKDVGFFSPSLQEPRALPNRKLKAEGSRGRRADTSQFLGHQKVGQEASKSFVSINSR